MLERNSNEAAKRFAQARHLFERCLVVSFFETASYGKTTGIVRLFKISRVRDLANFVRLSIRIQQR